MKVALILGQFFPEDSFTEKRWNGTEFSSFFFPQTSYSQRSWNVGKTDEHPAPFKRFYVDAFTGRIGRVSAPLRHLWPVHFVSAIFQTEGPAIATGFHFQGINQQKTKVRAA